MAEKEPSRAPNTTIHVAPKTPRWRARFLHHQRRNHTPLILCPGPKRKLAWLVPHNWFLRRACFYDLSGLEPDRSGGVRCPECGHLIHPDRALQSSRKWRPVPIVTALTLAIITSVSTPFFTSGRWIEFLPDTALVAVEQVGQPVQERKMRYELRRRVRSGGVTGRNARWLADKLAEDLRDDTIRFNADRALGLLSHLGPDAVVALERALASNDYQQRQMAASVLRRIDEYEPSDLMLKVTIEGLKNDGLPRGLSATGSSTFTNYIANASRGTPYIARHGRRAIPMLEKAMRTGDSQQQFLCAVASGFAQCDELLPLAAPILVEHLADNTIGNDATWAAPALFHFGDPVRPYLEPLRESSDRQQRDLALLILLELKGPATTKVEQQRRRELNRAAITFPDLTHINIQRFSYFGPGRGK